MEAGGQPQSTGKSLGAFITFSRQIMHLANQGSPRGEFLRDLSAMLLEFSGCDGLELRLRGNVEYRCRVVARPDPSFEYEQLPAGGPEDGLTPTEKRGHPDLGRVVHDELQGAVERNAPCFTEYGSFWTGELKQTVACYSTRTDLRLSVDADTTSMALIPFAVDDRNYGILRLECTRRDAFTLEIMEGYEAMAETLGLAIAQRRAERALRERVKELSCLYSIARVVEDSTGSVEEALERIVQLLPPAWQLPEIAAARITFDGNTYATGKFEAIRERQIAKIAVYGSHRGDVEVGYIEDLPYAVDGPFLREEEHLIDGVAREIGEFLERRQAEAERLTLEAQLRHSERLATIGKLAAGVAHEINEPLGSILGFAQLAQKSGDLPEGTADDLNKIVAACLQAREIVNKLKLFARQAPIEKARIDIAQVVDEALSLVQTQCATQGIEVVRRVEAEPCEILAGQLQLKQVVVNLALNSIHAMPGGGTLTVVIGRDDGSAFIEVQDTGVGMTEEVVDQIFTPFFTTKDVGEGTGLGLCVVHGIVTAHGGSIDVESGVGKGSRFTVRIPFQGGPESEVQ
ncbi:MAG: PAS domain-containing sensor histidine kinase [Gemmatimonadota bacterium]|nr:MAG: PAS domain-containing sensor histidine kinase [Gemmatimonadota bacterium]